MHLCLWDAEAAQCHHILLPYPCLHLLYNPEIFSVAFTRTMQLPSLITTASTVTIRTEFSPLSNIRTSSSFTCGSMTNASSLSPSSSLLSPCTSLSSVTQQTQQLVTYGSVTNTLLGNGTAQLLDHQAEEPGTILNERTNEFFINEGKGISTILFFIQPSGKTKSTKTIENKIIINSKTHINYWERERERERERDRDRDRDRQTDRQTVK